MATPTTLIFPELRGGPVQGLNDAGVENFQGAIDVYLSRECGQNSGDAHRPGVEAVRLEFNRLMMKASDIPAFGELQVALKSCLDRWGGKDKEREFFETAITLAASDTIPVLRISDYGTTGLTGDDVDEKGRWFALVKSQGVSNKEDTAGGSFGIGKSSPFAASRFRTVFYGTKTASGDTALQGVSRLVTHKSGDGKLTQGIGFIGNYDPHGGEGGEPLFRAIRGEAEIPLPFRRTEVGTDIWVIGYRSGPEWFNDLTRSILSNFAPAIHRGSISFAVGGKTISKENLAELIQQHVGDEDFEAHHFLKAMLNQPIKKKLKRTGSCELYLTASSTDLPRKICMVRNTGMKIYDYQPRACRVPFSGVFICTDANGNKLLRRLEPPRHDVWDPKRTEDNSGKAALDEIKVWIREEVKKLNPVFSGSSFNESELAKYIPDGEPEDPNDLPHEDTGSSEEKDIAPKPMPEELPAKPLEVKPVVLSLSGRGGGHGGPGPGRGKGGGGKAGATGKLGGEDGPAGTATDAALPTLQVRSFRSGADGRYEVVVRSDKDFQGEIGVQAVGEDGMREHVVLKSAGFVNSPGKKLTVKGDWIGGVKLVAGTPLRLVVDLDDIEQRSLIAIVRK